MPLDATCLHVLCLTKLNFAHEASIAKLKLLPMLWSRAITHLMVSTGDVYMFM